MIRRYMRPYELAEEFGVSIDLVRDAVKAIRHNIRHGMTRYSELDLIGEGKGMSIRTVAYMDAVKYKRSINTEAEQYLPTYDPCSMEYDLQILERAPEVNIEAVTAAVISNITSRLKGENL